MRCTMKWFLAIAIASLPTATLAENYLGILKAPSSGLAPAAGVYSFYSSPLTFGGSNFTAFAPDNCYRLKLGYRYSKYFSVESELSDFARSADVFANPASFSSAFRSTGFGIDTVATLPLWRFSFYGRMGAYHGDRNGFNTYATSLLGDPSLRGTRWRYGLGMRYDITRSLRLRAELERYSTLGSP